MIKFLKYLFATWQCRRCKAAVIDGRCKCTQSPSPWEPTGLGKLLQVTPKAQESTAPKTIIEAVNRLLGSFNEETLNYIKTHDSAEVHFSVGRRIRNEWGMWLPDSLIKRDAINTYGLAHADDISGLILEWAWAIVRSESFSPDEYYQRVAKHWRAYGLSPLQAGESAE